ncbi:hypothetical protein [Ralstonia pseudosolanacearum]|uniref:hypothetical protein n=1 Tax=Ralstonia pseudosolanacearum TaxID=1310165 RepID=UPI0026747884|nr:hypothetical protein [Ralstonia pseudosolanacearum]MDO3535956.1 hypothetical protein [Ralstonia pseudosolanacearum]
MTIQAEFNRVTFGLPIETFRVEAYIALDERLPVVTEFVLRLLRVCGRVPMPALRNYFGFTDGEALSVVESLSRQGLIELVEEDIQLSLFAIERFEEAGGDHPRFNKVELKKDTVTFDLISFTPLRPVTGELPTDNIIKLNAAEDALGESKERARLAYRQRYPEIASMRDDLREKSFGVHSIEDIESKRRSYLPIPVSFSIDQDGQVERKIDEIFERAAPAELIQFINEQVTAAIPKTIVLGSPGLEEFIEAFDLKLMGQYLTGKKFDLAGYLADVHVAGNVKYQKGVDSLFGNIYLQGNVERIVARIRDRREGKRRHGKLLTSLAWLTPDYELWGRGDSFAKSVAQLTNVLKTGGISDSLFIFANAEQGQENEVIAQFRVPQLNELHFSKPTLNEGALMRGRVELMLYPTGVMAAAYHLSLPGSGGLWAPIGFISTVPKHLDTAHKLIQSVMSRRRYGGRAKFTQKDARAKPMSFEEGCPFLQYSSLNSHSSEEDEG